MKRVLATLLAVVLAFGMAGISLAAPSGTWSLGHSGVGSTHLGEDDLDTVHPGDTVNYYLYFDGQPATRSNIRNDRITVGTRSVRGSRVLDSYEIKYDRNSHTYIEIEFADPFVSTSEQSFSFTLYLAENRTRISDTELEISGTMENWQIEVDGGDDYVDLTDYPVVEATEYVRGIEVYLGQGLSIHTRLFQDRKYYGHATQDVRASDDSVITRYPSIDTVYYLDTIGFGQASNTVSFDVDDTYYVYNADGQYVGTTNNRLPISSRYYLSTERIEMNGEAEDPAEESPADTIPVDPANPESGGDDLPVNTNDNPGTGRPIAG